jgi:phosphoserine aminotransferase
MNVVFRGRTKELEKAFLSACNARGLAGLEGHRTAGGFRASLYNAVPKEAVTELVEVMDTFEP